MSALSCPHHFDAVPLSGEILPADASLRPVLERLLQLYLHDFSGLATPADPYGVTGPDGLFAFESLDTYWREEGRFPLLIRANDNWAGFALVNGWSATGLPVERSVAEFFILRKYRRSGLGRAAIRCMLAAEPALWEVPVALYNTPALSFWRRALETMPGYRLEQRFGDGQRWSGVILRMLPTG